MSGQEKHKVIWPDFHKSMIFQGLPPKKRYENIRGQLLSSTLLFFFYSHKSRLDTLSLNTFILINYNDWAEQRRHHKFELFRNSRKTAIFSASAPALCCAACIADQAYARRPLG